MSLGKRTEAAHSDLLECLGADISVKIFEFLEDPSDLVRATAVSTSWRQFVVANGLCKILCLKMFPEMSNAIGIDKMVEPVQLRPDEQVEWGYLESVHKVYATLAQGLSFSERNDCLSVAIGASSTDNYPEECIENTLEPGDRSGQRASYWSSSGESDATVPEMLTYRLMAKACLITEIHVQPFQAFFQYGFPIYSAKSVRFLMGHSTCNMESERAAESTSAQQSPQEKYVWTYTSPGFNVAQENRLQKFKLPVPVLCLGGVLQVQLLGRVQKQEMDSLYYMCISHVQAVGRPLSSAFDVELSDASGKWTLRHHSDDDDAGETSSRDVSESPRLSSFFRECERMEHVLNTHLAVEEDVGVNEDNEDNEESDHELL